MDALRPHLNADGSLARDALERSMPKSTHPEHQAIEVLLKGPEARLPEGLSFHDKDGNQRKEVRLAWWNGERTFRAAALRMPGLDVASIPDAPLPEGAAPRIGPGGPVFFGHYWRTGQPAPLSPTLACVDYSAAKGGRLVAYRWDGETSLTERRFVSAG